MTMLLERPETIDRIFRPKSQLELAMESEQDVSSTNGALICDTAVYLVGLHNALERAKDMSDAKQARVERIKASRKIRGFLQNVDNPRDIIHRANKRLIVFGLKR